MSTQKGNTKRVRPQKYQNQFAFKNNLHDTSHKTKSINNIQVCNVCERCKKIIEWKIKYKKFKPLKTAAKCNKCEQKTVKHAYHTMCGPCARERHVCPKCGIKEELVEAVPTKDEQIKLDNEMQLMLKTLPERKRRTFIRYMNKQSGQDKKKKNREKVKKEKETVAESDESDSSDEEDGESKEITREDLITKLKSLMVDEEKDNDEFGSDFDDDLSDFADVESDASE